MNPTSATLIRETCSDPLSAACPQRDEGAYTIEDYKDLALLPQHVKMLVDSAISPEVAKAHGYRSITKRAKRKNSDSVKEN